MDVMITGTGFVGSNAARKFVDEGYSVIALDLNPQKPDYLDGLGEEKLKIQKQDVTSFSALEESVQEEKPRILVHTATYLNPTESFKVFEVNVRGTAVALELARKHDLTLVFLSSGAIYGQLEGDQDIDESEKFGPLYPPRELDNASGTSYSMSKRLCEDWITMYRGMYNIAVSALRLGWVYGRGISDYRLNSGISLFLRKAMVGQPLILPYGGDTFCDFIHALDVADAIFEAAMAKNPKSLAFNIVYKKGYYMKEVVEAVKEIYPASKLSLGSGPWPSKGVPVPRGGISFPSNRHMSIKRAREELGFDPKYDLQRGTKEYHDWMKKNWDICSPDVVPFRD